MPAGGGSKDPDSVPKAPREPTTAPGKAGPRRRLDARPARTYNAAGLAFAFSAALNKRSETRMRSLGLTELLVCLIPVAVVVVIAGIVVYAVRRKPARKTEAGSPAAAAEDSGPGGGAGNVGRSAPSPETHLSPRNGLATASLVLGILVLPAHILLGLNGSGLLGFAALITGVVALLQISKRGGRGKWAAIAGIALGTLPIILTSAAILLLPFTPS
jgi:hypothetical protein